MKIKPSKLQTLTNKLYIFIFIFVIYIYVLFICIMQRTTPNESTTLLPTLGKKTKFSLFLIVFFMLIRLLFKIIFSIIFEPLIYQILSYLKVLNVKNAIGILGTGGVTRAAVGCHKQNKDLVSGGGGSGSGGRVPASSTLAAALLDSGHQSFLHHDHRLLSRGVFPSLLSSIYSNFSVLFFY